MKNRILISIISLIICLGLFQMTYGARTQDVLFNQIGNNLLLRNVNWELGSSTTRIAKGWFADLNTTDMTIGGVSSGDLNMDSHIITNIGNTGTDFVASTGALVLAGDLTISGDDLYMNTNTLGAVLVGDDTNFNPVVLSGDASVAADGTMTVADLTCTDCINATEIEDIYLFNNVAGDLTASVDTSTLLTVQNTDTAITTAGYLLELIHDADNDPDADFLVCQDDGAGTPDTVFSIASDGSMVVGGSGTSTFNDSVSIGQLTADAVDMGEGNNADLFVSDDLEIDGDFNFSLMNVKHFQADSAAMSGATVDIQINVPSGAVLLAIQFNVQTAIEGATTWDADMITGNTTKVADDAALALNTKVNYNFTPTRTTAETDVRLTANVANFTAGVVRAVVYYYDLTNLPNN